MTFKKTVSLVLSIFSFLFWRKIIGKQWWSVGQPAVGRWARKSKPRGNSKHQQGTKRNKFMIVNGGDGCDDNDGGSDDVYSV